MLAHGMALTRGTGGGREIESLRFLGLGRPHAAGKPFDKVGVFGVVLFEEFPDRPGPSSKSMISHS